MRLIVVVYDALRSFDRPCTRADIEREAQLSKLEVEKGLLGLRRRGALLVSGLRRQRMTYALREGAERPEDLRGRYERSGPQRRAGRIARRTVGLASAADPPV